jgi:hypothetical protein
MQGWNGNLPQIRPVKISNIEKSLYLLPAGHWGGFGAPKAGNGG